MRALANEEFKIAGELIVCSIIQGGPAPSCFSDIVYDYIIDGMSSVKTESWAPIIQDGCLKDSIKKVDNCSCIFTVSTTSVLLKLPSL